MTRSGMAAIFRAVLYSGFFLKREEFSSVDASSVLVDFQQVLHTRAVVFGGPYLCKLVRILAQMGGST